MPCTALQSAVDESPGCCLSLTAGMSVGFDISLWQRKILGNTSIKLLSKIWWFSKAQFHDECLANVLGYSVDKEKLYRFIYILLHQ